MASNTSSRRSRKYFLSEWFNAFDEAKEAIDHQIWSSNGREYIAEGEKWRFICKLVPRRGELKCPAGLYILDNKNKKRYEIYVTEDEHANHTKTIED